MSEYVINLTNGTWSRPGDEYVPGPQPYDDPACLVEAAEWVGRMCEFVGEGNYVVFSFRKVPPTVQAAFDHNGGDEDWLVVGHLADPDYWDPHWVETTDSCQQPNRYTFVGEPWVVYVGSHA